MQILRADVLKPQVVVCQVQQLCDFSRRFTIPLSVIKISGIAENELQVSHGRVASASVLVAAA